MSSNHDPTTHSNEENRKDPCLVNDPYKPSYVQRQHNEIRSFGAGQSNLDSRGMNVDPTMQPVYSGYREHIDEKNPLLYQYKDSKVPQPLNIVPSEEILCMSCKEMVRCSDVEGHMRSKHSAGYETQESESSKPEVVCGCCDMADTKTDQLIADSLRPSLLFNSAALNVEPVGKVHIPSKNDSISNDIHPAGRLQCQPLTKDLHEPIYQARELPMEQYYSKAAQPLKYGKSLAMDWDAQPVVYKSEEGARLDPRKAVEEAVLAPIFVPPAARKAVDLDAVTFQQKPVASQNYGRGKLACSDIHEQPAPVQEPVPAAPSSERPQIPSEEVMFVPYSTPITQEPIHYGQAGCCSCSLQCCTSSCAMNCCGGAALPGTRLVHEPIQVRGADSKSFSMRREEFEARNSHLLASRERPAAVEEADCFACNVNCCDGTSHLEPLQQASYASSSAMRRAPSRYVSRVVMQPVMVYEMVEEEQVRYMQISKEEYDRNPDRYRGAISREEFEKQDLIATSRLRDYSAIKQTESRMYPHEREVVYIPVERGYKHTAIKAHQIEEWKRVYKDTLHRFTEQEFDQSFTDAIWEGVRTREQFEQFVKNKAS